MNSIQVRMKMDSRKLRSSFKNITLMITVMTKKKMMSALMPRNPPTVL